MGSNTCTCQWLQLQGRNGQSICLNYETDADTSDSDRVTQQMILYLYQLSKVWVISFLKMQYTMKMFVQVVSYFFVDCVMVYEIQ